jgi:thiamine-monophosphate kinase
LNEADLLARLRAIATHPAARGLADDAAVLGDLVLTHDMLVEGVHFLASDPPEDVAWKLLAVNLSDLAAKGAVPLGVLMGFTLGDDDWDRAFVDGLGVALAAFGVPLLGGDTVAAPARVLGLTAIGRSARAPARSGARAGDGLWVTGTIGAAGAGLEIARSVLLRRQEPSAEGAASRLLPAQEHSATCADRGLTAEQALRLSAYRRPQPRLTEGQVLAPVVSAMMDVSDGLLIDASRMAAASGLALSIDLDAVPLAEGLDDVMAAATAGDDYELLFAFDGDPPVAATRIGTFGEGAGLSLTSGGAAVAMPARLGWEHQPR